MDTFIVVHIEDPGAEPFWTVLDVTAGRDFRDAHKFPTQPEAEQMADIMNGKLSGDPPG
jgi:hypothetical protein